MLISRAARPLLVSVLAGTSAVVLGSAVAPALTVSAPQKITASGVGAVKLGKTYTQLRAAHLVGRGSVPAARPPARTRAPRACAPR